jgi:hypothetical protein
LGIKTKKTLNNPAIIVMRDFKEEPLGLGLISGGLES